FFFQAEDGIRDYKVTGVQTCALPIYNFRGDTFVAPGSSRVPAEKIRLQVSVSESCELMSRLLIATSNPGKLRDFAGAASPHGIRSEERRVGKEGRSPLSLKTGEEREL